ncbi:MAG TPA: (2Fe-2S)-binding protein [Halanaerobiales bacterium]|nr:(2Fe-2S)-binding protein [Halanaerobiales bacterium]
MRIKEHPILDFDRKREITFTYNGKKIKAYEGETIAAALYAAGIRVLKISSKYERPRGLFCAIGNCSSCHMVVDGTPNVKTCITKVQEGMVVKEEVGKGDISE